MAIIRLSEWIPDAADLGNPGFVNMMNAVPGTNGYKPMPSFVSITGALDDYARGAIDVRDKNLNVFQFAGDENKLYELSGTTWDDVSLGGGYATGTEERWEFVLWKNKMLATNFDDDPQSITLGGSNFANMTTDLKFRHIATVGDFVVTGNTDDVGDGLVPDRIRWSAFNDETDWTVSPITGSDFRDLKGGAIQRIFGGEFAVILEKNSVWRMDFEGSPTFFRIDETLPGVGTISPAAASRIGNTIYTLSENGFYAITNGTGSTPIGAGIVDEFIQMDLDDSFLHRITSVADARSGRIFWAYPGAGNTAGMPNKIIIYDSKLNKWAQLAQEVELLWTAGGIGTTLEQLDSFSTNIDTLTPSLDSSQWKGGGAALLSGFNSSNEHGSFSGMPMTATIDTKEVEIHAGRRTRLNAFTPLVDGGTVTAEVGARNRQTDEETFTASLTQSTSGRFTPRSSGRFHRIRLTISGAWTDAVGVEINDEDARRAEGRG